MMRIPPDVVAAWKAIARFVTEREREAVDRALAISSETKLEAVQVSPSPDMPPTASHWAVGRSINHGPLKYVVLQVGGSAILLDAGEAKELAESLLAKVGP